MNEVISSLEKISIDAVKTFGKLSAGQINWRPSETGWSVGQCFDHLIKSNEAFEPQFQEFASGNRKQTFWQNYSPLTGFFGNFLLKSLKNDAKKFKAPGKAIVPPSEIPADIIERFAAHQNEICEKMKALDNFDWHKTVVTSPFLKLMTYRLDTAFEIAVEHEKRHFRQAERVTKEANFPK
ncbi:hypothetical protein BH20ACI4_BH20ACI4_30130 [soil metagenome]